LYNVKVTGTILKRVKMFIQIISMNFTEDASAVKKLPFTFSLMFQLYRESGWRSLFAGKCARVFVATSLKEAYT